MARSSRQYGKTTVKRLTWEDLVALEQKGNISIVRNTQQHQSPNKAQIQRLPFNEVEYTREPKKARSKQEFDLQVHCIKWLDTFYPDLKNKKKRFHVANQGWKGGERTGKLLKAMGKTAGVCDLFILVSRPPYPGLLIDFKSPGEHLSPQQELFFTSMTEEGFLCRTVEEFNYFERLVTFYLGPPKPLY